MSSPPMPIPRNRPHNRATTTAAVTDHKTQMAISESRALVVIGIYCNDGVATSPGVAMATCRFDFVYEFDVHKEDGFDVRWFEIRNRSSPAVQRTWLRGHIPNET